MSKIQGSLQAKVTACAFGPDGQRIVSASEDNTIKIWDASNRPNEPVRLTPETYTDEIFTCKYSQDGRWLFLVSIEGDGKVWDAESGKVSTRLEGHKFSVTASKFSSDM